jgi:hypothetical protein
MSRPGVESRDQFVRGLRHLKGCIAWSSDEWDFGTERRRWNGLQNVRAELRQLSLHLVQEFKRAMHHAAEAA